MTQLTPAEAMLQTLAQLAKIGRIEIWQQKSLVNVQFNCKIAGEPVQLHAMEPSLQEALVILTKQATGRIK